MEFVKRVTAGSETVSEPRVFMRIHVRNEAQILRNPGDPLEIQRRLRNSAAGAAAAGNTTQLQTHIHTHSNTKIHTETQTHTEQYTNTGKYTNTQIKIHKHRKVLTKPVKYTNKPKTHKKKNIQTHRKVHIKTEKNTQINTKHTNTKEYTNIHRKYVKNTGKST